MGYFFVTHYAVFLIVMSRAGYDKIKPAYIMTGLRYLVTLSSQDLEFRDI